MSVIIKFFLSVVVALGPILLVGQSLESEIQKIDLEIKAVDEQKSTLLIKKENIQFQIIQQDILAVGLPSADYITHDAMFLEYSEEHEQAKWVAHIILPEIAEGNISRTNDFRVDEKIKTGSAVEEDYFLKYEQEDGSFTYDGFGWDRGHLAPAADFRWSPTAVSQSFYYSNMSPQIHDFNAGIWLKLENALRLYVTTFQVPLYVVTMPIFDNSLNQSPRSKNGLAIPKGFIKVAIDLEHQRGMGVYLDHKSSYVPLSTFARPIDEIEELVDLDFFNKLDISIQTVIESNLEKSFWFPELAKGDTEPISIDQLPSGHINTSMAYMHVGSNRLKVCGNVVATHATRKGDLWINLDRKYPNQVYSGFVQKDDLVNFSYDIEEYVKDKQVCIEGRINELGGAYKTTLTSSKQLSILD